MKRLISITILALCISIAAYADEGMWMAHAISKALEQQMHDKGLKLSAGEIYNEDGTGLNGAIVSLDFGCTGSFISDKGLVITNHHCAYGDVYALGDAEHNYLEDGFWAMYADQEIPIKDKKIQILRKVIDVTAEAKELAEKEGLNGKPMGMRRLSYIMEKKYSEQTGMMAFFYSMWKGSEYYMALYEEYSDIRLVAAPPVSIAAFGGDIDNWEWPQHKCDFAMYRVYVSPDGKPAEYAPENIPLTPSRKLGISTSGYAPGDFTMVMGYPGRTDRYASSSKVRYQTEVSLPISNEVRGKEMEIITKWMNIDPEIRRRYSNYFFGLSNVQELNAGEVLCYKRFKVAEEKEGLEKDLNSWISSSPERKATWGSLTSDLASSYEATTPAERNLIWFRECLIRGSRVHLICTRIGSLIRDTRNGKDAPTKAAIAKTLSEIDMRVEREIFGYTVEQYYHHVSPSMWGPYQTELRQKFGDDSEALCSWLWDHSTLTSESGVQAFIDGKTTKEQCSEDPVYKFYNDAAIVNFNKAVTEAEGDKPVSSLEREYTHALYQMRRSNGTAQYPDANSSLRLTYGTVGGYEPKDGIWCSWMTTPAGLLAKHDPDSYDFCMKSEWKSLLETEAPETGVDFLTDNDITGGNSGSPVLNAEGQLIGLAFDGNKESLAGDTSFTAGYNKCVCVDIRFVLWTLKSYAHMDRILDEIGR